MLVSSVNSQTDTLELSNSSEGRGAQTSQTRLVKQPEHLRFCPELEVDLEPQSAADAGGGVKVDVTTLLVNDQTNSLITRMFF